MFRVQRGVTAFRKCWLLELKPERKINDAIGIFRISRNDESRGTILGTIDKWDLSKILDCLLEINIAKLNA